MRKNVQCSSEVDAIMTKRMPIGHNLSQRNDCFQVGHFPDSTVQLGVQHAYLTATHYVYPSIHMHVRKKERDLQRWTSRYSTHLHLLYVLRRVIRRRWRFLMDGYVCVGNVPPLVISLFDSPPTATRLTLMGTSLSNVPPFDNVPPRSFKLHDLGHRVSLLRLLLLRCLAKRRVVRLMDSPVISNLSAAEC